jgi:hypothetical protein
MAVFFTLSLAVCSQGQTNDAYSLDLSGRWELKVYDGDIEVCHGPMVLTQSQDRIAGSYTELDRYSEHMGQTGKLEGSVQGSNVTLTLTFSDGHFAQWTGTVGTKRMTGTLTAKGKGQIVWSWTALPVEPRKDK